MAALPSPLWGVARHRVWQASAWQMSWARTSNKREFYRWSGSARWIMEIETVPFKTHAQIQAMNAFLYAMREFRDTVSATAGDLAPGDLDGPQAAVTWYLAAASSWQIWKEPGMGAGLALRFEEAG